MFETSSGLSKKSDMDLWDTELFLKRRKSYDEDDENDDNTPWMITFADLMTILLIFSFVLFALNHKDDKTASAGKQTSDISTSLVTIAHANTKDHTSYLTIPLYINDEALEAGQSRDEERIILKKSVRFVQRSTALNETLRSELSSVAELSKKNPTAKIIISSNIDGASKLSIKRAMSIVDYFVDKCSIEKKKIFLQSIQENTSPPTPAAACENISEEEHVEVKLTKPFWWF